MPHTQADASMLYLLGIGRETPESLGEISEDTVVTEIREDVQTPRRSTRRRVRKDE